MAIAANGLDEAKSYKDNADLVSVIASKYATNSFPVEDLEQEGAIGLLIAIRKWDPTRGASLRTYAAAWILDHIQRAIGRTWISDETISKSKPRRKTRNIAPHISFDEPHSDEDMSASSLHEVIPSPAKNPEQLYGEAEIKCHITRAVALLSPEHKEAIDRRLSGEAVSDNWRLEANALSSLSKRLAS